MNKNRSKYSKFLKCTQSSNILIKFEFLLIFINKINKQQETFIELDKTDRYLSPIE